MNPRQLSILDFTYELPNERIAAFPLPERDASKLLVYQQGAIQDRIFRELPDALPEGSLLVVNNTRVVEARLVFETASGARIEVFYLEPAEGTDVVVGMAATGSLRIKALVGNLKKWKDGPLVREVHLDSGKTVVLQAILVHRADDHVVLDLSWSDEHLPFADLLHAAGNMPLPPYIKREVQSSDAERYQTVYARHQGSVAAPTAGLHFTERVLTSLARRGITQHELTLHVGAGTFRPVKAQTMAGHDMHAETIDVSIAFIESLMQNHTPEQTVAVGTTSLRTLESLYWMGVRLLHEPEAGLGLPSQWYPYDQPSDVPVKEALGALHDYLRRNDRDRLFAQTPLLIAPGYRVRMVSGLITNFHQPQSTLLLLVAACIGDDWRRVYRHAMDSGYRFLSYGDSSLLWLRKD